MNRRQLLAGTAAVAAAAPIAAVASIEPQAHPAYLAYRYLAWLDRERRQLAYELGCLYTYKGTEYTSIRCDRFINLWAGDAGPAFDRSAAVLRAAGVTVAHDPGELPEPEYFLRRAGLAPHPDAALIEAEAAFVEAWEEATEALAADDYDEHGSSPMDPVNALADRIYSTRPRTVAGAAVKLRLLQNEACGLHGNTCEAVNEDLAEIETLLQALSGLPRPENGADCPTPDPSAEEIAESERRAAEDWQRWQEEERQRRARSDEEGARTRTGWERAAATLRECAERQGNAEAVAAVETLRGIWIVGGAA